MQHLLTSMDRRKAELLKDAAAWGPEALLYRPAPGVWCALDVLDHLAKMESEIAGSMLVNSAAPHTITARDKVTALIVYLVMYAPSRIKAPPGAETVLPRTPESLEEVEGTWKDSRLLLTNTLQTLNEQQVRGGVFRHPVSGWMSAKGTLRFLESHLAHHRYQWERLRTQALKQA